MNWLPRFDLTRVRKDFDRVAKAGMGTVRIFLRWDDLQPTSSSVDAAALGRVVATADIAAGAGLDLVVTLFTGHMSGVNWIPKWATGGSDGDERFRVVTGDGLVAGRSVLRNWYADAEVRDAQAFLAHTVATALAGHPAMWAWDLGNENSNCTIPPDRATATGWMDRMSSVLRACDPNALVTIGTHMEDLEDDRMLGPEEVAEWCDVVCMHGYPIYAGWSRGPTDPHLVPFLSEITAWLARETPVLFAEFGHPTSRRVGDGDGSDSLAVGEDDAATYAARVLDALHAQGAIGALAWCYADYDAALFDQPPLDLAVHERSFGLWRSDGTPKPSVAAFTERRDLVTRAPVADRLWMDVTPEEFADDRRSQLQRLYGRYLDTVR